MSRPISSTSSFSESLAWQAVENVSEVLTQVLKVQARLEAMIGKLEKLDDRLAAQEILGFSGQKVVANKPCFPGFGRVSGVLNAG